jgi:hypothetical protein
MEAVALNMNKEVFRLVEEAPPDADAGGSRLCVAMTTHSGPASAGIQSGDLLTLEECRPDPAHSLMDSVREDHKLLHQLWKWNKATGEMIPLASLDTDIFSAKNKDKWHQKSDLHHHPFCLTAGWPYLNAVSFLTPNQQTVVTVMNEYPTDTYVLLKDQDKGAMWTALNGKSIQTITF